MPQQPPMPTRREWQGQVFWIRKAHARTHLMPPMVSRGMRLLILYPLGSMLYTALSAEWHAERCEPIETGRFSISPRISHPPPPRLPLSPSPPPNNITTTYTPTPSPLTHSHKRTRTHRHHTTNTTILLPPSSQPFKQPPRPSHVCITLSYSHLLE